MKNGISKKDFDKWNSEQTYEKVWVLNDFFVNNCFCLCLPTVAGISLLVNSVY